MLIFRLSRVNDTKENEYFFLSPNGSPLEESTYGLAAWVWWFVTGFLVQLTTWFTHMMMLMMMATAAALVMVVSWWRSPAHATLELGRWSVLGRLDHFARAFPIAQVRVEETDL